MNDGYFSKTYINSFSDSALPIYLKNSNGWVLKKNIPNSKFSDLTGCYPYLCCQNWEYLAKDLNGLNLTDIVSMSFVTDPFAKFNDEALCSSFDFVKPFKNHIAVNLSNYSLDQITKHHRKEIKRSLNKGVKVELCKDPISYLHEWNQFYKELIKKHKITNNSNFSLNSFSHQLKTPGLFMFRAYKNDETIGFSLWYANNNTVNYHLSASNHTGYNFGASYALMSTSLSYFKNIGIKYAGLGAGAGLQNKTNDGLVKFKSGWSDITRPTYFVGKIINPLAYQSLSQMHNIKKFDFFPAYRQVQ